MKKFLQDLIRPSIIFCLILILTIIVTYFICEKFGFDPEKLFTEFENRSLDYAQQRSKFEHTVALFTNNIQVPVQIMLLAMIPIPFFYTIVLIFNGILNGIIFYIYNVVHLATGKGDSLFWMIVKGYLPHSIIEFLAFIIATAVAYRISQWIFRKIGQKLFGKSSPVYTVKELIVYSLLTFTAVILPLTVIAAVIEGFITPLFL